MLEEIERLDLGDFVTEGSFVLKPSIGSCKNGFKEVKTVKRGGFYRFLKQFILFQENTGVAI
jgi:hypothetical protein